MRTDSKNPAGRVCQSCLKPLPPHARQGTLYCPRQPGQPRCSDVASVAVRIARKAPPGAVGFRISMDVEGTRRVWPPPGQKRHTDARGQRSEGDFYRLGEAPRVPCTGEYRLDYIDGAGVLMIPAHGDILLHLEGTGGRFQEDPGPTVRAQSRAVEQGLALSRPRLRVHELAKQLDIEWRALLVLIRALGLPAKNHLSSIEEDDAGKIRAAFAQAGQPSRNPPAPPSARADTEPPPPSAPPAPRPEPVSQGGSILAVPPLVAPFVQAADRIVQRESQTTDDLAAQATGIGQREERHVAQLVQAIEQAIGVPLAQRPADDISRREGGGCRD